MLKPHTLCELFQFSHRTRPRPNAYLVKVDDTYVPVSSQAVVDRVHAQASALRQMGVQPGDRIGILSANSLEWAIADYATLHCGAVTVPVYPTLQADVVQHILGDCEAMAAFVADAEQFEKLGAPERLPHLQNVVLFEGSLPSESKRNVHTLHDFETRGVALHDTDGFERVWQAVKPNDLATIIYTSGTTGVPKGVMLSHDNIVFDILSALQWLPLGSEDSCLSFLPLSHIFERMAGHFVMWHAGASIAIAENVDSVPENLLEVRPTVLVSVPRLYEKMNARVLATLEDARPMRQRLFAWAQKVGRRRIQVEQSRRNPSLWLRLQSGVADRLVFCKLRARLGGRIRFMISGGAPLAADIAEFFHAARLVILEGYGLTETSPVIAVNPLARPKIGSVGRPLEGVEVRIAENGEILTRGRHVMGGYYGQPEATERAIVDGWFHTGDIGELDAEGYLRITDRLKDLIVTSGGKNIAPQAIEARLKTNPYVSEAILIGDKRKYLSALIVPQFAHLETRAKSLGLELPRTELVKAPAILSLFTELLTTVNASLPPYERLKRYCLLDRELQVASGEITPSMKVKRNIVAKKYAALIDSMYEEPVPAHVGCPGTDMDAAHPERLALVPSQSKVPGRPA